MSKRPTNKLCDGDIVGLKYFDRLLPLLERLHDVGVGRGRAGNRRLPMEFVSVDAPANRPAPWPVFILWPTFH